MPKTRQLAIELRPNSFATFIGNEKITAQIKKLLDEERIPTAFLFSGPSGTGKTTLAYIISKELDGELVEINASDETGVAAARAIGEASAHRPLFGRWLIICLDEVHRLSKQAQDSLLKYIEGAPDTTLWILCTTNPSKLEITLRDRCKSYQLKGLDFDEIGELLAWGKKHLGKSSTDTGKLAEALVEAGISAPRTIVNALERFLDGLDPIEAISGAQGSPLGLDIARAVVKPDWSTVAKLLQKANSDEAIAIRNIVAGYLKSMLLKNGHIGNAMDLLELTASVPWETGLGLADLSARLFRICEARAGRAK